MASLDVNFDWPVCDAGYRLKPPRKTTYPPGHVTILEKTGRELDASPRIVPKTKGERHDQPLEYHETLYGEFAKLDGSEKSCIDFANRYGLLGLPTKGGEALVEWQDAITWMAQVVELSRSDPMALAGYQIAPLHGELNPGPPDGRLILRFRPTSLLHGMQLQFAQAISSGLAIKECRLCGNWFEAGGDRRRRDAQFCSKEHKIAFHNLEKRRVTR